MLRGATTKSTRRLPHCEQVSRLAQSGTASSAGLSDGRLVVHWPGAPGLRDAHRDALEQATLAAGIGSLEGVDR